MRVPRDRWGIPHVVGGDVGEVARRQGAAVVADRLWQVTHGRLKAEGRVAELLGGRGLAWDRFARRVGLDDLARRAFAALDEESQGFLRSYVSGVNEALADGPSCAELTEVGHRPGPWHDHTPIGVFAAHHVLFGRLPHKLYRHHLRQVLGEDLAGLFNGEGSWAPGSNAWAVGGARTASGLPMVGGDPHRTFERPNCYQQVRLVCTDPHDSFDVAGFTFPGVPGVQHFAHAGRVAWGITNAMGDYQDVYAEELAWRDGRVHARDHDGWRPVQEHTERLAVRDGEAEEVVVRRTARGPVFHGGPGEPAYSLRTASDVLGDLGLGALLPLLRARSVADVEAALAGWVEPVNNLVVADDTGTVRHRVVGRVPRRAEENRHGAVPGWRAEHAWRGWEEDLPVTEVPDDGEVVTANDRMSPAYDRVGPEFAPPARADRIRTLLSGRTGLTRDDFEAIHGDVLAGQPMALREALTRLGSRRGPLPPAAAALRERLLAWDRRFATDSAEAAGYVAVRSRLVHALAALPALAPAAEQPFGPLFAGWMDLPTELYLSLERVLSARGRALLPEVDQLLVDALETVAADPPSTWGPHHRYDPWHQLGHPLPDPPALAGDNDAVRCTGSVPGSDTAVRGSVARYVWDLASRERSGWVVPLGADGDPAGTHHRDQLPAWRDARTLDVGAPLSFSQSVVSHHRDS